MFPKPRPVRCYTVAQLLVELQLSRSSFFELKAAGKLPFLEELQPRIGRQARFRAEPIDRYLENRFSMARSRLQKVG